MRRNDYEDEKTIPRARKKRKYLFDHHTRHSFGIISETSSSL